MPEIDLSPFRAVVRICAALHFVRYSYFDPQDGFSSTRLTLLDPEDPDASYVNPDRQARIDGWPANVLAEREAGGMIILQVYSSSKENLGPVTYDRLGTAYTGEQWRLSVEFQYHHENWLTANWAEDQRVRRYLEFASATGDGSDWEAHLAPGEQEKFGFRLDEGPATVGA